MMRLLAAALLALSVLLLPGLAWAEDALPLPKPDPKGVWRVITQDDATTTSKCIGSTATPLCAMETFLASRVRYDEHDVLYRKSALLLPDDLQAEPGNFGKPVRPREKRLKYRILSAEVLTGRDIPPPVRVCSKKWQPHCKDFPSAWHPGDVRIKITSRECWGSKCRHGEGDERGEVLRRAGDEWKAVLMHRFINRLDDIDGKPLDMH